MLTEQLTKPTPEQKLSEMPIDEAISRVAESRGVSLEPQRLRQLVAQVEYRRGLESRNVVSSTQFEDNLNNVRVEKPEEVEGLEGAASKVDFTPIFDDEDDVVSGTTYAGPERATEITLKGINGMQNYALLVEAGLLERPDILYGETNPTMAITAERMGMLSDLARSHGSDTGTAHEEMRRQQKLIVSGAFEDVSTRLFSSDTQRLERLLARRQASTKPMGHVALR